MDNQQNDALFLANEVMNLMRDLEECANGNGLTDMQRSYVNSRIKLAENYVNRYHPLEREANAARCAGCEGC